MRLDAASAGAAVRTLIEEAGGKADIGPDPLSLMKARKNRAELAGARAAHLRDGAAVARFLSWFAGEAPKGGLTEIDATAALERFRRDTNALKGLSFPSISGAGPNAALPHYRVSHASNRRIEPGIFLIDSGGQYEDGTTDITRTLAVGDVTAEMRDRYTRVLKGHVAISRAVFRRARPARRSTRWPASRSGRRGSTSTTAPATASAPTSRCTRARSASPSSGTPRSSPA